ncbi:hypothetical protein OCC_04697 [Thermococcus litoralis DSM 5473]|uniref:Uncharacterized protein n=1 Tax=Thermococcus litoralis (strain ATCC 51850 / DSM 5473 / JCM 8560 / NS-C) TaxID=523849 RepID=H3ZPT3_THELN|nr:hypothetical protein [Thermococcus litoralis]EHR77987.1 hypothetical protein OCC_04697 [Thermococcus litoralis DSM 5473]
MEDFKALAEGLFKAAAELSAEIKRGKPYTREDLEDLEYFINAAVLYYFSTGDYERVLECGRLYQEVEIYLKELDESIPAFLKKFLAYERFKRAKYLAEVSKLILAGKPIPWKLMKHFQKVVGTAKSKDTEFRAFLLAARRVLNYQLRFGRVNCRLESLINPYLLEFGLVEDVKGFHVIKGRNCYVGKFRGVLDIRGMDRVTWSNHVELWLKTEKSRFNISYDPETKIGLFTGKGDIEELKKRIFSPEDEKAEELLKLLPRKVAFTPYFIGTLNLSEGVIEGTFHKAKLEVDSWRGNVLGAKVFLRAVGEYDPRVEVEIKGLKDYSHVRKVVTHIRDSLIHPTESELAERDEYRLITGLRNLENDKIVLLSRHPNSVAGHYLGKLREGRHVIQGEHRIEITVYSRGDWSKFFIEPVTKIEHLREGIRHLGELQS